MIEIHRVDAVDTKGRNVQVFLHDYEIVFYKKGRAVLILDIEEWERIKKEVRKPRRV